MNSADDMTKFWRCAKRNDGCTARVKIGRDAAYEQMIRGEAPAKKRKKYVDADARIKKLVVGYSHNFSDLQIIEFLRGIANNSVMNQ